MSEDTRNQNKLERAKRFIEDLKNRGLINDITNEEDLVVALSKNKGVYLGIDPTADFLHLGHYLPLTLILRFLLAGYRTYIVIGGVTAQIGDPSFRSKDRTYNFDVASNSNALHNAINNFFKGINRKIDINNLTILNNLTFLEKTFSGSSPKDFFIWFLKEICSSIKVSELIHKDFIKDRLETGLTLSEFLYPTLQAFDFFYLMINRDVFIQIGGSDQWTNILTGKNLIERKSTTEITPVGFTFPILSDSSGKKFGKSDGNAIRIFDDKNKNFNLLSFHLFQYLLNLDDALIVDYAKMLTFVDLAEIEEWSKNKIMAKKNFSYEVCKDIYGSQCADHSRNVSAKLFSEKFNELTSLDILAAAVTMGNTIFCDSKSKISLKEICMRSGLVSSGSEFQRNIKSKGIKVFSSTPKEASLDDVFGFQDCYTPFFPGNDSTPLGFLVVKKGKKSFSIVLFIKEDFNIPPDFLFLSSNS